MTSPKISGAIFANNYPNGPSYTGVVEIDGQKYEVALWEKTAKSTGKPYLQVSENKKKGAGAGQAPQVLGAARNMFKTAAKPPVAPPVDDMDGDDIPF